MPPSPANERPLTVTAGEQPAAGSTRLQFAPWAVAWSDICLSGLHQFSERRSASMLPARASSTATSSSTAA